MHEMVTAKLKFLANLDEPLVFIPSKGGGDRTEHVGNFEMREVSIHDARTEKASTSLDLEGFILVPQETTVTDFYDDAEIEHTYHEELKSLLTNLTDAVRIDIFDDTRRASSVARQNEKSIREPADIVHNDYTAGSGINRLRNVFSADPGEAEKLLERRFAIVNVWRSIGGPVLNYPLALCDARTVDPNDLVPVERRAEERIGEIQVALFNPQQRWYYYPEMQMHEVLIFKTFDSATDGRTRFTMHSSFEISDAPADAPPRESIETRCLVFF
jgi:hypothetical protein